MSSAADSKLDELKKVLFRLKEALAVPKSDTVRDSAIQRFEFTVELSWKVLHRYLKSSGVVEPLTPKNVFREAAKLGIVKDSVAWIRFVDARNLSSHTYKESLAEEVYASALLLPPYAEELVQTIEQGV